MPEPPNDDPADQVLQRLGRATEVSRIYPFRDHTTEGGRLLASQIAEWTQPEIEPGSTIRSCRTSPATKPAWDAGPGAEDAGLVRPSRTETILPVEDDDAVRGVTTRILARSGYPVLEASSAAEGLSLLRSHGRNIDLLMTDAGLPDRSGTELADEVEAFLRSLPVLFISGFPSQRAPDLPLADEPRYFLPKPFTHEQLPQRVRERLDEGAAAE